MLLSATIRLLILGSSALGKGAKGQKTAAANTAPPVVPDGCSQTMLYQFYSDRDNTHLESTNLDNDYNITSNGGYVFRMPALKICASSVTNTTALFRGRNFDGQYMSSTNRSELDFLQFNLDVTTLGYVFKTPTDKPMFRQYTDYTTEDGTLRDYMISLSDSSEIITLEIDMKDIEVNDTLAYCADYQKYNQNNGQNNQNNGQNNKYQLYENITYTVDNGGKPIGYGIRMVDVIKIGYNSAYDICGSSFPGLNISTATYGCNDGFECKKTTLKKGFYGNSSRATGQMCQPTKLTKKMIGKQCSGTPLDGTFCNTGNTFAACKSDYSTCGYSANTPSGYTAPSCCPSTSCQTATALDGFKLVSMQFCLPNVVQSLRKRAVSTTIAFGIGLF